MFKVGDKVKVVIPPLDNGIARGMHRYHGKVSTIKEVIHYTGYNKNTYTLVGFVSPFGLDYEWTDDTLVAVESEG